MAENYLQHAEHYNRIIAAAQAQLAIQQARDTRDETDEDGEDDQRSDGQRSDGQPGDGMAANGSREHRQHYANDGSGPQPVIEGTPAELAYNNSRHNGSGEQPQPPAANGAGNGESGHVHDEHTPEAAASEESPAPRRTRRPRRKPSGAQPAEADAAGASEQPGESSAMEQAE
jgi:hypothetical protein